MDQERIMAYTVALEPSSREASANASSNDISNIIFHPDKKS